MPCRLKFCVAMAIDTSNDMSRKISPWHVSKREFCYCHDAMYATLSERHRTASRAPDPKQNGRLVREPYLLCSFIIRCHSWTSRRVLCKFHVLWLPALICKLTRVTLIDSSEADNFQNLSYFRRRQRVGNGVAISRGFLRFNLENQKFKDFRKRTTSWPSTKTMAISWAWTITDWRVSVVLGDTFCILHGTCDPVQNVKGSSYRAKKNPQLRKSKV